MLSKSVEIGAIAPQNQVTALSGQIVLQYRWEGYPIRVAMKDGVPWWVVRDFAKILGFRNPREAARYHVSKQNKGLCVFDTPGGPQQLTVVNESGVYSLILNSTKPKAVEFRDWNTDVVLPSIRKTGRYELAESQPPQLLLQLEAFLQKLHGRGKGRPQVRDVHRHRDGTFKCKVSSRIYDRLSLEELKRLIDRRGLCHSLRAGVALAAEIVSQP